MATNRSATLYDLNPTEDDFNHDYSGFPSGFADYDIFENCSQHVMNQHPTWVPVITAIITITGLLFNGLALFVIIVLKDFRKSISHWYVLQLAIADSIFLALLPLRITQDIRGEWNLPEIFCKMYQGVFMLNYYSGIFFLTVMSFDRYVAIVHPVSAAWRRFRTHSNAVIISVAVWILSILVSLPLWIFAKSTKCVCSYNFPNSEEEFRNQHGITESETYSLNIEDIANNEEYLYNEPLDLHNRTGNYASCRHQQYLSFKVWVYGNFIVAFMLPVLVMSVCYTLILWRVLHPAVRSVDRAPGGRQGEGRKTTSLLSTTRSSVSSSRSSSIRKKKRLSQKQRVTTIVVSLVIIFIVCWLPFHINLIAKFKGHILSHYECLTINDVTSLMAFANSMLNPIFYTFLGSKFQRRLSNAVVSLFRGRPSARIHHFSTTRNSRLRAQSSGKSSTKVSDVTHHTVHSTVTATKPWKSSRQRHQSAGESEGSEHQMGQEVEMKPLKK